MKEKELYELWKQNAVLDPDLIEELNAVSDEDAIVDRFYTELEFGTAGLRGVIGAGTNRMNVYTVGRATQGLAQYLLQKKAAPSVAIAYDSRIKSETFAEFAARVLAANGVKVYLFEELVPTPVLSFAVRRLGTDSGIIITASHNPAKYNGYKCYNPNGYQMTDAEALETYGYIQQVDYFTGIKTCDFDAAVADGRIVMVGQELVNAFLDAVETQRVHPDVCGKSGLHVIYTPLNGTGNKPVRAILSRIGVQHCDVVKTQELPDGNFPTCPYPNPEIRQAFEQALLMAKDSPADLLLATDPDCDRVGIAVRDENGEYRLMSGNQVGVLLLNYLLSQKKANGTLPAQPVAVKSFVSTDLAEKIAEKYNCGFKNLLTGFKYIGELITNLEKDGRAGDFILGFEESYGYLAGTHARDKDAVVASMLICEMAAFYKLQGQTLLDVMNDIYETFGYYVNQVANYAFEGAAGMEKMHQIMDTLRSHAPKAFAGHQVLAVSDYESSVCTSLADGTKTPIDLPKSNVLAYKLEGGAGVIVRPSGTEPKIKTYVTAVGTDMASAQAAADALTASAAKYMEA